MEHVVLIQLEATGNRSHHLKIHLSIFWVTVTLLKLCTEDKVERQMIETVKENDVTMEQLVDQARLVVDVDTETMFSMIDIP